MENENIDAPVSAENTSEPTPPLTKGGAEPASPLTKGGVEQIPESSGEAAPLQTSGQATPAEVQESPVPVVPAPVEVEETKQPEPIEPIAPPLTESGALSPIKNLLLKARAKIQWRRQRKLEKILELARQKGGLANQDVEKLLRVSDATATRYLSALVKASKLKMVSHPRHARYEPVN